MSAIDRLLSAADVAAWWGIEERLASEWINEGRFGPVYGTRKVRRVTEQGVRDGTLRMQVQVSTTTAAAPAQVTEMPLRKRQRGALKEVR